MLRGLGKLSWLEIKIFAREPMGLVGTVVIPVLVFLVLGRIFGRRFRPGDPDVPQLVTSDLPIFAALLIALSTVLSLVTIIAIYRESGILKRLRATPLRAQTILTAHVLVKLVFTAATLALLVVAGRRYYPYGMDAPFAGFAAALLLSTLSVMPIGFLIAAVVPTARFAQPLATLVLYPLLGVSGLFVPVEAMPSALQAVARLSPLTYATSLLRGVWHGAGWAAHAADAGVLLLLFLLGTAAASRVFRWE
jgi:ABC-2 type transport system permease protein